MTITSEDIARLCSKDAEIAIMSEKINNINNRSIENAGVVREVHALIIEMRSIREDLTNFKEDIKTIKAKPGETLKWLVGLVGSAIIVAIMALVLKAVGLT